jgi:flagellar hook-associated protein 3 FlgL
MRISSSAIASSNLHNIENASERFFRAQQTVSTGRRLNKLMDDPSALPDDLSLHSTLDGIAQFQKNIDDARAFVGASATAVGDAVGLVRRARVLALQAATDANATENRDALAGQVDALIESLAGVANSSYGSRFLFSGQRTDQAPFAKTVDGYEYKGGSQQTGDAFIRIDISVKQPIEINKPGDAVFSSAFEALKELRDNIKYGQPARISQESVPSLDRALDSLIATQSELGAKGQNLQTTSERYSNTATELTAFLSKIEDADIPKAILEMRTAQTAYEAALTSSAQSFQQSLLDFLR